METKRHHLPIDGTAVVALLSLLLLGPRCAIAQSSSPSDSGSSSNNYNNYGKFNPTTAVVIVIIISAFFFLGYFSIYARNCAGDGDSSTSFRSRAGGGPGRSRWQQGLSPEVIETFPMMVYAEVKGLKEDKGALECAVCLSEFEDDEELRLLPHCNHVFHADCIDAWLASHVTCPVCRANLAEQVAATADPCPQPDAAVASQDDVAIVVDAPATGEEEEEAIELARIGSQRRAARSRSRWRPAKFSRSHSTGHSVVRPMEGVDRYTLRLPEDVRKEILAARKLHRSASCVAVPNAGEGSSRPGPRVGGEDDGSSRRWRSFRFGKSERWPSFFFRTLSVKIPAWPAGRRVEDEGSVKKAGGDGSMRGKEAALEAPTAAAAPSFAQQV